MSTTNVATEVAQIYPPEIRDALRYAGAMRDTDLIDELKDKLAAQGYCRSRHDGSRFESTVNARRIAAFEAPGERT